MKAVVVLPTKNEEKSIEFMVNEIKKLNLDVFVSDEQSTDKTLEIAKKLKVPVYQRDGSGKGFGVRKAIQVAKEKGYDILILIDCDKTYPTKYIPELLKFFPKYDMVVGARKLNHVRLLHRLPNMVHTESINLLYGSNLRDINSGLRAFNIDKMPNLNAKGFDVEAQITTKAIKKKLKIKEVPIVYEKREGDSKIRIKDGFLILSRILKERIKR
ncbi:MAG: glycosyltransferase family 2 protein [Candidatus Woesearchaeota archaeon]|jgi:glycosyltransferase involved in cell wall biosynthesis|nr:glycosyltransferase family 2 protein [Candidatus Woesearchaeota archaeon]